MKNLLYKELKLSLMPVNVFFLASCLFILIPSYPYSMSFIYIGVGLIQMFNLGRENNELFYASLLPVRKSDIVKSRFVTVIALELTQVVLSIPMIYINAVIGIKNNAGLEANWALLGEGLFMFGVFNLIFLTMFYKSGVKTGVPFICSFIPMLVLGEISDIILGFIPGIKELTDVSPLEGGWAQYVVFIGGLVICSLMTLVAYKASAEEAKKIEL
jgi:hypothetical protein